VPRRKDGWLTPLEPGRFPYVNSECLCDAPRRCPCGNPWQPCDEGLRCIVCGKRWRVAAVLRARVGTEFHEENLANLRVRKRG